MAASGGQRPAMRQAVMTWVKEYGVATISVLGVILFGALRLAYLFFYLPLRTTPEEVGYNYSRVLSEQLVGALALVLLITVPIFGIALGIRWLLRRKPRRRAKARRDDAPRRSLRTVFGWSFVAASVLVVFSLPALAWWQGSLARGGQTVRNVYFIGVPRLPVLAVQAVPARVDWIDPTRDQQLDLSQAVCLMYLGQADGSAIFYDPPSGASVRLPVSDIYISLRDTPSLEASCHRP